MSDSLITLDAFGNTLTSGDTVQLTNELAVKGTKVTLKKGTKIKNNPDVTYALQKAEIGRGNQIPLWMFGFLY